MSVAHRLLQVVTSLRLAQLGQNLSVAHRLPQVAKSLRLDLLGSNLAAAHRLLQVASQHGLSQQGLSPATDVALHADPFSLERQRGRSVSM